MVLLLLVQLALVRQYGHLCSLGSHQVMVFHNSIHELEMMGIAPAGDLLQPLLKPCIICLRPYIYYKLPGKQENLLLQID